MQAKRSTAVIFAILLAALAYMGVSRITEAKQHRCNADVALCGDARPRQAGLAISAYYPRRYTDPALNDDLLALRRTGATWVAVQVSGWQPTVRSTSVTRVRTPSDADLLRFSANAHKLGFKVLWLLDVQLLDEAGAGRDMIGDGMNTTQAVAWFASYRRFTTHFASLAAKAKVEEVSLGSSLRATQLYSDQWRRLIREARAEYDGALLYTATPEEAATVQFWSELDYVGLRAYFPLLPVGVKVTDKALAEAWKKRLGLLERISSETKRSIVFTEIGYPALAIAAAAPFALTPGPADETTQAALYRAAYAALWEKPWVAGIFPWRWTLNDTAYGYSPAGKKAEAVIKRYYKTR